MNKCYTKKINKGTDIVQTSSLEWYLMRFGEEKEVISKGNFEELWKIPKFKNVIFGFTEKFITENNNFLKENNVRFFCLEYPKNLFELNQQIDLNVTHVEIRDSLCFNLKDISNMCHKKNIKIICELNYNHSYSVDKIGFFVRPEDVCFYDSFIDYGIIRNETKDPNSIPRIYDNGVFNEDLQLIIYGLNVSVKNLNILSDFGETRSRCNGRCLLNKCSLCDRYSNASNELIKNDIAIR